MAGRTYLIPGSDGAVVPAGAWAGGGGGMGGGAEVIEVHSHVYLDGSQVAESVRSYDRNNGRPYR
jgi:hypothetical protein